MGAACISASGQGGGAKRQSVAASLPVAITEAHLRLQRPPALEGLVAALPHFGPLSITLCLVVLETLGRLALFPETAELVLQLRSGEVTCVWLSESNTRTQSDHHVRHSLFDIPEYTARGTFQPASLACAPSDAHKRREYCPRCLLGGRAESEVSHFCLFRPIQVKRLSSRPMLVFPTAVRCVSLGASVAGACSSGPLARGRARVVAAARSIGICAHVSVLAVDFPSVHELPIH